MFAVLATEVSSAFVTPDAAIVHVEPSVQVCPLTVVAELASAEFGTETSLAFGSVPDVMFAAFVVSVVAEVASVTAVLNPPAALLVRTCPSVPFVATE